ETDTGARVRADDAILNGGREKRAHRRDGEANGVRRHAASLDRGDELADVARLNLGESHPAEERRPVPLEVPPVVVEGLGTDATRRPASERLNPVRRIVGECNAGLFPPLATGNVGLERSA